MLKGTKSISINYQCIIGNEPVIYMSATIPENGMSTSSKTISNLELYEANKAECRKDMQEFDEMLFALEDQQVNPEEPQTIPEVV